MHHATDRITHTTAFVTPVVEHWMEYEIGEAYVRNAVKSPYDVCVGKVGEKCSEIALRCTCGESR